MSSFRQKFNKKVIYIITKLELGGAQKICLALFKEFSPNSYLLSAKDGYLNSEVKNDPNFINLNFMDRPVSVLGFLKDILCFIEVFFNLLKLKHKYPYLIVHTHSSKAGFIGRIAAKVVGSYKIVHTVHGFGFNNQQSAATRTLFMIVEQIGTLCSDNIICVSNVDKDFGSKKFFGFKRKATIIRAAIDEKLFLKQRINKRIEENNHAEVILGTVSCFKPQKNLIAMLSAISMVAKRLEQSKYSFVLEVIGDGEERLQLEEYIKNNNLSAVVRLLGWQLNVAPIMAKWDIFLLSSLWEGLPCSIIQARILRLACVCYNTGGIKEIIINGENGFLIEQDITEMAEKIIFLMKNPIILKRMQLYQDELDNFYLQKMIVGHRKVYNLQ